MFLTRLVAHTTIISHHEILIIYIYNEIIILIVYLFSF